MTLQRRPVSHTEPASVPPIVHDVLRSPGQPLDPATRAFMEPRFGHDFSRVRVHADARAAESAQAVNALAYTVGRDVVFGAGQYAPQSSAGKQLLAHELTHVVQQKGTPNLASYSSVSERTPDGFEQAAQAAAKNVVRGRDVTSQRPAPPSVQRQGPPKTPTCGPLELFTEIDLPWPVDNSYFRGDTWKEKDKWEAELETALKGKCEAKGEFEDVKLSWDLGNPELGTYWGINVNKHVVTFDINPRVVYAGDPCCPCFTGTATYSFDVEVSRKKGKTTETGKTKSPIKGSIKGEDCDGKKCCAVDETMKIDLLMGDDEITARIKGKVAIAGATYKEE